MVVFSTTPTTHLASTCRPSFSLSEHPQGDAPTLNVTWFKHTGPGSVVFSSYTDAIAETEGMVTTTATFEQPGEYLIRVRADNFGRIDSSAGNQCCWTNGYVKVTVTS